MLPLNKYLWKNIRKPLSIVIVFALLLSIVSIGFITYFEKHYTLISTLNIAHETAIESLKARDWNIIIKHFTSISNVSGIYNLQFYLAPQLKIVGPIGTMEPSIGDICYKTNSKTESFVYGCISIFNLSDISKIIVIISLLIALTLLVNLILRKKLTELFDYLSNELSSVFFFNKRDGDSNIIEINKIIQKVILMQNALFQEQQQSAIAKTTQMLAHDVRKPFSLLKIGLQQIENAETLSEIKKITTEFIPEVNAAIISVNGMIDDVMEIGRTATPHKTPVSPETLIESTLKEVLQINAQSEVKIEYNFNHTHMVDVEEAKLNRVFSNITHNAIQAIKEYGGDTIWFNTEEMMHENSSFIKFTIGNNGPSISAKHIDTLFEAFFTSNKKGGTGLGLAIAKKIIVAHGGKIWCESPENGHQVEFFFTLPIETHKLNKYEKLLPKIASEYRLSLLKQEKILPKETEIIEGLEHNNSKYELQLYNFCTQLGRNIAIGIVDDEALYRNAVKQLILKSDILISKLDTHIFTNSQEVLTYLQQNTLDYLICDVDMGNDGINGFELTRTLVEMQQKISICIHSNRSLKEDYDKAMEMGARAFLPKPITKAHLFKFIVNEIPRLSDLYKISGEIAKNSNASKPKMVVLDDSRTYRRAWELEVEDAEVLSFKSPEEFLEQIKLSPNLLGEISIIITDQNFDEESTTTGIEFAENFKLKYNSELPILLCSNGDFHEKEIKGKIDLVIPKEAMQYIQCRACTDKYGGPSPIIMVASFHSIGGHSPIIMA